MAQNPSSVSSALTQTTALTPVTVKETSPVASLSSNAALRSDLVQEAVDFLNNPRVASAPLATKRKFLTQRKGLTEAEVDEAVRRSNPGACQKEVNFELFIPASILTSLDICSNNNGKSDGGSGTATAASSASATSVLWSARSASDVSRPPTAFGGLSLA